MIKIDQIEEKILNDGFIYNDNISRKWLVVQALRHNDFVKKPFDQYFIDKKPYKYEWATATNEIKTLSKISDPTELKLREKFFNNKTIQKMLDHYKNTVLINKNPSSTKQIMGIVNDIDTFLYQQHNIPKRVYYKKLNLLLSDFCEIAEFPPETEKSQAWITAFKNSGAYFTIENLIKYHGCRFYINNRTCDIFGSLKELDDITNKTNDLTPVILMFLSQNSNNEFIKNKLEKR